MFTKIRHVAIHTENYDRMAKFYQTILGMKKITTSPGSGPRKIAIGREGATKQKNLEACRMGCYATSDTDGVLLHFSD